MWRLLLAVTGVMTGVIAGWGNYSGEVDVAADTPIHRTGLCKLKHVFALVRSGDNPAVGGYIPV